MIYPLQPSGSRLKQLANPIKTIAISGATGRLGSAVFSNLVPLARRHNCELILLARNDLSFARQTLMIHDALAGDIANTVYLGTQDHIDALVMCSGVRTSKSTNLHKKDALFATNREILDNVIENIDFDVCLLATNPSTSLVLHAQQRCSAPVIGIGVQNDNVCFQAMDRYKTREAVLVGAHNFTELVHATLSPNTWTQTEYDECRISDYKIIAEYQDTLLEQQDFRGLLSHLKQLPPDLAWWASQRANTVLNDTTFSAANVIAQLLQNFLQDSHATGAPAVIELEITLDGRDVVLGWPFDFSIMSPLPIYTTEGRANLISLIADKYKLQSTYK